MLEIYKKVVLKNYANFNGRARRKEYWMFFLASVIINFIFGIFESFLPFFKIVTGIYGFAVLIPAIAVGVRRMHDINKSGWFLLIPIYNIVLLATEGEKGPNQYGADPKNQLEDINEIGKE
ncbi:DUF805 domain-containing protein [Flavobacterium tistrianum]|uniref:DUF805 domain-containing protein n=1 Tax=Flavobacterium tistrianum TaxID=1685414 RepID=UPI000DAEBF4C|nr:DUF805 domain-containing protein [Flavobacterium tistrianum]KAF2339149.1 DUF805 domain-containing protein [Flavobacterium tistrianum]